MSRLTLLILPLVLVAVGFIYISATKSAPKTTTETTTSPTTIDTSQKSSSQTVEGYSGKVLAGSTSPLLDFKKGDYDKTLASDKLVVLYFYANWCPICKEEVPKLEKAFNELHTDKVVGFRLNFNDNETDNDEKKLAEEFGVGYQHTKILLKNGKSVLRAIESWDKEKYLKEISKI